MRRAAALLLPLLLLACGEERAAERPPERIVALAPSLAETLFALGLGERVVGVGDYTEWPPEAAALPHLGGLFDPNLERIVALEPDLAVLLQSERDLATKLERLGIGTLLVPPTEDLADVERTFRLIAGRAGMPEQGERLAAELGRRLAPRPVVPPGGEPLTVMVSVAREPGHLADLLVAGPGTFYDDFIRRLGAENAFADAPVVYPQVGLEEVLARAPDVVLELGSADPSPERAARLRADWRSLPELPPPHVAVLAGNWAVVPGPRLPVLYEAMERELRAATAARTAGAAR